MLKKIKILSIHHMIWLLGIFSIQQSVWALSEEALPHLNYSVCFTPQENCTQQLVEILGTAKQTILVQAYSFTSAP